MKDGENSHSPLSGCARPEKALWYQEVLSLDPQSRIFLPYARFLAGCNAKNEAVQTIRAGLAQHPEFLEARLLLIQLLHEAGEREAADREGADIIEQLSRCPALWEIWSRRPGVRPDQAAMLLFLSSSLGNKGLGLAEVLHAGIKALAAGGTEKAPAPLSASEDPRDSDKKTAERAFVMEKDIPWRGLDSVPEDDEVFEDEEAAPLPRLHTALEQLSGEATPEARTIPRDAVAGKSSLHTRSMASILEEQGVYADAADIYRELLKNCFTENERSELLAKLESLDVRAATSEDNSMMAQLEELAARLEQKARV